MKFVQFALSLSAALSLCACEVAPSPTAPSVPIGADRTFSSAELEPSFFRAFLQNGFESPDRLEPIRTLKGPLRVYMRSQDDRGRAIDDATLQSTEQILREIVTVWSGGTFGVTEVTRGTSSRENLAGWITVKWQQAGDSTRCGRSTVGNDGALVEFNLSAACGCGAKAAPYERLVRHELGHAMGYYHTDSAEDVMYGQPIPAGTCDLLPSERERRHARVAYGASR